MQLSDSYRKKTVLKLFLETVAAQPNATAARIKQNGVYQSVSWDTIARDARLTSLGLMALGIAPNDHVSILAGTRLEWIVADLGVLGAAAITVPIYQSNPAPDCAYILNHADAVAVVVEDEKQLAKIKAVRSELKALKHVIIIDGKGDGGEVISLAELQEKGRAYGDDNPGAYEKRSDALTPDMPLTIIYTSGTTGNPKGAVLTHSNMAYEAEALSAINVLTREDEQLLFLPMAHVFRQSDRGRLVPHRPRDGLRREPRQARAKHGRDPSHHMCSVPGVSERSRQSVAGGINRAA